MANQPFYIPSSTQVANAPAAEALRHPPEHPRRDGIWAQDCRVETSENQNEVPESSVRRLLLLAIASLLFLPTFQRTSYWLVR